MTFATVRTVLTVSLKTVVYVLNDLRSIEILTHNWPIDIVSSTSILNTNSYTTMSQSVINIRCDDLRNSLQRKKVNSQTVLSCISQTVYPCIEKISAKKS